MAALLITYDLNRPGQSYDDLHAAIKKLGAWWHYLDSTWIVVSSLTPSAAFEQLRSVTDESDTVLVIEITHDAYSGWMPQKAWDWLATNVKNG